MSAAAPSDLASEFLSFYNCLFFSFSFLFLTPCLCPSDDLTLFCFIFSLLRRCIKLGKAQTCFDFEQKKRGWRKGRSRANQRRSVKHGVADGFEDPSASSKSATPNPAMHVKEEYSDSESDDDDEAHAHQPALPDGQFVHPPSQYYLHPLVNSHPHSHDLENGGVPPAFHHQHAQGGGGRAFHPQHAAASWSASASTEPSSSEFEASSASLTSSSVSPLRDSQPPHQQQQQAPQRAHPQIVISTPSFPIAPVPLHVQPMPLPAQAHAAAVQQQAVLPEFLPSRYAYLPLSYTTGLSLTAGGFQNPLGMHPHDVGLGSPIQSSFPGSYVLPTPLPVFQNHMSAFPIPPLHNPPSLSFAIGLTPSGTVIECPEATSQALGYGSTGLLSQDIFRFLHESDVDVVRRVLAAALQLPPLSSFSALFRIRNSRNDFIWIDAKGHRVSSSPNSIIIRLEGKRTDFTGTSGDQTHELNPVGSR